MTGTGSDLFPAINVTCPFSFFQNLFSTLGTWLSSVSIQSALQHSALPYLSPSPHWVSGHHLCACLLHILSSPHIPSTLSPITPVNKFQKVNPLNQITQVHNSSPNVHTLLSIIYFPPSIALDGPIFSGEKYPSFFLFSFLTLSSLQT